MNFLRWLRLVDLPIKLEPLITRILYSPSPIQSLIQCYNGSLLSLYRTFGMRNMLLIQYFRIVGFKLLKRLNMRISTAYYLLQSISRRIIKNSANFSGVLPNILSKDCRSGNSLVLSMHFIISCGRFKLCILLSSARNSSLS
jgi:hypothetical protein